MRQCLLLIAASAAIAQTPPADVVNFVRSVADALAQGHSDDPLFASDASPFLDKFDPKMPGYSTLRDEVESLLATAKVGSAIDIVRDDGNDQKRSLELDWLLQIEGQPSRRKIVKCQIEREGKNWKITTFEPIDLFKP